MTLESQLERSERARGRMEELLQVICMTVQDVGTATPIRPRNVHPCAQPPPAARGGGVWVLKAIAVL